MSRRMRVALAAALILGTAACHAPEDDGEIEGATVAPLLLLSAGLPDGTGGVSYDAVIAFSGGTPPYRFDVVDGEIPWGLRLDAATGRLSGIPSTGGQFSFVVRLKDSGGQEARASYDVSVVPWNTVSALACGDEVSVSLTRSAVDEWGRYRFASEAAVAFFALSLPPSETTVMTVTAESDEGDPALFLGRGGEPPGSGREGYYYLADTEPGPAELRLHDAGSPSLGYYRSHGRDIALVLAATEPGRMTLRVECGDGAVLTTPALPNARAGQPYRASLAVLSNAPPWRTSAAEPLPAGLSLSEDGVLSGEVSAPGVYSLAIRVEDASGSGETRDLDLWAPDVVPVLCGGMGEHHVPLDFDAAALGTDTGLGTPGGVTFVELTLTPAVSRVVLEADGVGSFPAVYLGAPGMMAGRSSWGDYVAARFGASGAPARLELDTTMVPLLGDYAGVIPVAVASDLAGEQGTLAVHCEDVLDVQTVFLPNPTAGVPYEVQLESLGGQGAHTWSMASDSADGIEISTDGLLSGVFQAPGPHSLSVAVRDDTGATAQRTFSFRVGDTQAPAGCGDVPAVACDTFVSGTLEASAWSARVEVDFSVPDAAALFCVVLPPEASAVEVQVSSTLGDMDLFAGYPGMGPGDREVGHYWFVSAGTGDDAVRIDEDTMPSIDAYPGVIGAAVAAYQPGDFLLYVDCGE